MARAASRRWPRGTTLVLLALTAVVPAATACASRPDAEPGPAAEAPPMAAQIVQLRRDQVLERVQVAVTNRGSEPVVVERLRLAVEGYRSPAAVRKDSPIPAGQVVNLPWTHGSVRCSSDGQPAVGAATVTLRVRLESASEATTVRLKPRDPDRLLDRIAERACTVERIMREVDLRFGDTWRAEQTRDGVVLHGELLARLSTDEPRIVTQVAGAIMYGLRPDESAGPVSDPLARLTPGRPSASIPVLAYAARCDPHTIGEIKKPFEFLVWVGEPGAEPVAVTPQVGQPTKDALRLACAF